MNQTYALSLGLQQSTECPLNFQLHCAAEIYTFPSVLLCFPLKYHLRNSPYILHVHLYVNTRGPEKRWYPAPGPHGSIIGSMSGEREYHVPIANPQTTEIQQALDLAWS